MGFIIEHNNYPDIIGNIEVSFNTDSILYSENSTYKIFNSVLNKGTNLFPITKEISPHHHEFSVYSSLFWVSFTLNKLKFQRMFLGRSENKPIEVIDTIIGHRLLLVKDNYTNEYYTLMYSMKKDGIDILVCDKEVLRKYKGILNYMTKKNFNTNILFLNVSSFPLKVKCTIKEFDIVKNTQESIINKLSKVYNESEIK